jgi:hypothetical protein
MPLDMLDLLVSHIYVIVLIIGKQINFKNSLILT